MATFEQNISKVITTSNRLALNDEHLRHMLQVTYEISIPTNAEIYVQVPGGADWSNTSLDINEETPLIITWEIVENSNG